MSTQEIKIPADLWSSVLIALEQCIEQLEGDGDRTRREEVRRFAQRVLRTARPKKVTH